MATQSNWQHDWAASEGVGSIGRSFFLYAPPTSGADNDINVFAYHDATRVTITDVTVTPTTASGPTSVNLDADVYVVDVEMHEGEDLIVRENGLGLDILDPGHTYWLRASNDVTVQYGHLGQVTGGNQARDGAGFVPSANGSAVGSLYYFAIPHNPGREVEKELRIVCHDDGSQVVVMGADPGTSAWTSIVEMSVGAGAHLDLVGRDNPVFRDTSLYKVTVSPAYHRCTVFEGNWMETGSYGTSDFASGLSGDNGANLARHFYAYIGPPGLQNNVTQVPPGEQTNLASPQGALASHLYVYAFEENTEVTVSDVDSGGQILLTTFDVPADDYYDLVVDSDHYTEMSSSGRRPYVSIEASHPVMVMSGNFNDNWMAYFSSGVPPEPQVQLSLDDSAIGCGEQRTVQVTCRNGSADELGLAQARVWVPDGLSVVSAGGASTGQDGSFAWTLGSLQAGFEQTRSITIENSCASSACIDGQLLLITAQCSGSLGGRNVARVASTTCEAAGPAAVEVLSMTARDFPDYLSEPPAPHIHVEFQLQGQPGATGTVTLLRSVDSGDADAPQVELGQWPLQEGMVTLTANDPYTLHFEETRFYRLKLSQAGCEHTIGPVAVRTSSGGSGGEDSGLESNGDLSDQLAHRAITRRRYREADHRRVTALAQHLGDTADLVPWFPQVGPGQSAPTTASPGDLPALTNAESVYAVDYFDGGGARVASALMLRTKGAVYEHQKSLCDRAGGARVVALETMQEPEGPLMRMAIVDPMRATGEYAVEVKLYADGQGGHELHSNWLGANYAAPEPDQTVLNLQVWSPRPGLALSLLRDMIEHKTVRFGELAEPPPTFIERAAGLGGRIELAWGGRFPGGLGERMRITRVGEDGSTVVDELQPAPGDWEVLEFPPFLDVTIELLDADGSKLDAVWVTDGAWTQIDDRVAGGTSSLVSADYVCNGRTRFEPDARAVKLSGCASMTAKVDGWSSLVRHLGGGYAPLPLDRYAGLAFGYRSDSMVRVCLDDAVSADLACASLPASPGGRGVELPWAAFTEPKTCSNHAVRRTQLVSFTVTTPGEQALEVSDLAFLEPAERRSWSVPLACEPFEFSQPPPEPSREIMRCAMSAKRGDHVNMPVTLPFWVALLAGRLLRRRRRDGRIEP